MTRLTDEQIAARIGAIRALSEKHTPGCDCAVCIAADLYGRASRASLPAGGEAREALYLPDGWDVGLHSSPCCRPGWEQNGGAVVCRGCHTRVTLSLADRTAVAVVDRSGVTGDGRKVVDVREIRVIPQPAPSPGSASNEGDDR